MILLIAMASGLYASGTFSMGVMIGAAGADGDLNRASGDLNLAMRRYQVSTPGTSVTEIDPVCLPVASVNFGYISDSFMAKIGWEYSTSMFYAPKGSVGGNSVGLDYTRFTFPACFGIVIPAGTGCRVYFAGGMSMSYISFEITQSSPGFIASMPKKSYTYNYYTYGLLVRAGIECQIDRNYSFVVECTRYFGNHTSVESEDKSSTIRTGMDAFEIMTGVNYSFEFSVR